MNRRRFLGWLAPLVLAAAAHSQGVSDPLEALHRSLGVTPEQSRRLKAIDDKYRPRLEAIAARYRPLQDKLSKQKGAAARKRREALIVRSMQAMQEVMAAYRKESDAVFTKEQLQQMKAFQETARTSVEQPAPSRIR